MNPQHIPSNKPDYDLIRTTFENAVKKRMMTDVP
jgi:asparagine synthetase B (glutamine-hydrolysing)